MKERKNNRSHKKKKVIPDVAEEITAKIINIAESLCESEAMELVHVEYHHEQRGLILRIYIDKLGGVTLDDCTLISRQLSDLLDIHIEDNTPYNLEVSSPGLDRPLVKEFDFQKFKGESATIKTAQPVDGQKNFKGILMGISEGVIKIDMDGRTIMIPHKLIARARLINYNGENRCL